MIPVGLVCWNGMTPEQQERVVVTGAFAGYEPNPDPAACREPATVGIEQDTDRAPGLRYYCRPCAQQAIR